MTTNIEIAITKEDYIKQIKALGQKIIEKADFILGDFNDNIQEIEITSKLAFGELPKINVNKKYVVLDLEEENNNE